MSALPGELASSLQLSGTTCKRATRRIDKGGPQRMNGGAQQSMPEVVSTLSHDSTIGQDDGRTAIREADMLPPPLEIERASQAAVALPELFHSVGIVYLPANKT